MCGIVGAAGDLLVGNRKKAFKELLEVDVLRGRHATGVACVDLNGDVQVVKDACLPQDLKINLLMNTVGTRALIGHNRHATSGAVDDPKGAHPFDFENVVGVHNGTLRWGWERDLPLDSKKFDVDSEAIYYNINHFEKFQDVYETLDGALALCWYDKQLELLSFIRNHERTLYYTFVEDMKTIYWASEVWMLNSILHRNNIKHGDVYVFEPHHLYTIDVNKLYKGEAKFLKKKMKEYVRKSFTNPCGRAGGNLFQGKKDKKTTQNNGAYSAQKLSFEITGIRHNQHNGAAYYFGNTFRPGDPRVVKITTHRVRNEDRSIEYIPVTLSNFKKYFEHKICFADAYPSGPNMAELFVAVDSLVIEEWEDNSLLDKMDFTEYPKPTGTNVIPFKEQVMTTWKQEEVGPHSQAEDLVQGFNNDYLTKELFEKSVGVCANCDGDVGWEDRNDIKWVDSDTVLCKSCVELGTEEDDDETYMAPAKMYNAKTGEWEDRELKGDELKELLEKAERGVKYVN